MTRLDSFLLILLAGLGWGCGFAIVGLGIFRGVPDNHAAAAVFALYGFTAGAALATLRLAMAQRLPQMLARGLRDVREEHPSAFVELAPASVFGA